MKCGTAVTKLCMASRETIRLCAMPLEATVELRWAPRGPKVSPTAEGAEMHYSLSVSALVFLRFVVPDAAKSNTCSLRYYCTCPRWGLGDSRPDSHPVTQMNAAWVTSDSVDC